MKRIWLAAAVLCCVCACARGDVTISEVMTKNGVYQGGEAYDWVELYNSGKATVQLAGYQLSDGGDTPYTFEKGASIKGGGYLLVYCAGEETTKKNTSAAVYNQAFKLASGGETVTLFSAKGKAIDSLLLPAQYGNVAYGRAQSGETGFLDESTPGAQNSARAYHQRLSAPVFDTAAGFYDKAVSVRAHAERGVIRYTTDGSEPTQSSPALKDALTIKETAALRLRAFDDDYLPSETVTATYFIADPSVVDVISLSTDEAYITAPATGLMVKGTGKVANYRQDWEYPVNIEYFTADGARKLSQIGTFKISGGSSRINAQKTMAVYARDALGLDRFYYNPFENRDYDSYKTWLLRSANSDARSTRLRDPVLSQISEGLGLYYQSARAIVVYINGRYWGHYNLREKINKYAIAQFEGVTDKKDIDNIDILEGLGTSEASVQNGDYKDWAALMDFLKKNDLNDPDNMAYAEARIDFDNVMNYSIYQMLIGNLDYTNIKVYRVPGGKWKYLLFDVEAGCMGNKEIPVSALLKPLKKNTGNFQHAPLAALLEVPEMKDKFLKRVAEIVESNFLFERTGAIYDSWQQTLEPLMPRHLSRWKSNTFNLSEWRTNIKASKYYCRVRPKLVIGYICDKLGVKKADKETYFGQTLALLEEHNVVK